MQAFRAGVKGLFPRSGSIHSLIRCVHAVHQGQIWASSAELDMIMRAFALASPLNCVAQNGEKLLTRREFEVLQLVGEGLTNREIADRLELSEHTIKNHLFRIYDKLGISTRVELILYGMTGRQL